RHISPCAADLSSKPVHHSARHDHLHARHGLLHAWHGLLHAWHGLLRSKPGDRRLPSGIRGVTPLVLWPGAPYLGVVDTTADWATRMAGADGSSGDGASPCWFCVLAVRISANR